MSMTAAQGVSSPRLHRRSGVARALAGPSPADPARHRSVSRGSAVHVLPGRDAPVRRAGAGVVSMAVPMVGACHRQLGQADSAEATPKAEILRLWDESTTELDVLAADPAGTFQETMTAFGQYPARCTTSCSTRSTTRSTIAARDTSTCARSASSRRRSTSGSSDGAEAGRWRWSRSCSRHSAQWPRVEYLVECCHRASGARIPQGAAAGRLPQS